MPVEIVVGAVVGGAVVHLANRSGGVRKGLSKAIAGVLIAGDKIVAAGRAVARSGKCIVEEAKEVARPKPTDT